ncbi:pyridoxine 5'-phosphate synthase [Rubinisphaera margarita]|uniref:pyridoxine 5'-phosphate synthase n=1 Tax=Rubinisphaera margarita TaxID=2909586 RepID=UPI001EE7D3D3|nr:pyridoxine 5'-phosphate synthase [Rubinisphaera margarita]MCG6155808.1 pyridoxine 5'-phosphate synthase [Rubinisphaera margarita]
MPKLGVNIDHVATVRQARKTVEPDPVWAAALAELGGADGITVHLREDRRHIQDRDVRILRETVRVKLNLEMSIADEITDFALDIMPDQCTLVPEKREEVTTEGGLDLIANEDRVRRCIDRLLEAGIEVSLFIDPDEKQIAMADKMNVHAVELHTGQYADAVDVETQTRELDLLSEAAAQAHSLSMLLHMGHGLTYRNVGPIVEVPEVSELNIGHSIVSRAVMVGMERAVREMKALLTPPIQLIAE